MKRNVIPYQWVMLDFDVDAKRIDSKTVECEVRVDSHLPANDLAVAAIESRGFATSNVTGFVKKPDASRIRVVMNVKKKRVPLYKAED